MRGGILSILNFCKNRFEPIAYFFSIRIQLNGNYKNLKLKKISC